MKISNPLIIGAAQRAAIAALRDRATASPMDVIAILELVKTPNGMIEHIKRMRGYTIPLPVDYVLTFSIETGHPVGTARHMSMSSNRRKHVPTPEAVWMVAEELGFVGGLDHGCKIWMEPFGKDGKAVNIVQPLQMTERAGNA